MLPGTPELYLALSEVRYEQGDLAAVSQLLLSGETLRQQASLSGAAYLWWAVQARLKAAEGDLETALDQLHEAERLYARTPIPIPDVRPIEALRVRWWLRQGRLAEALGWVRECGLLASDPPSYLHEYEHLTLASVEIAQYRRNGTDNGTDEGMHQVIGLLTRLLSAAEAQERTASIIEILVVLALARAAQGDLPAAMAKDRPSAIASLERALLLAEPEGHVRIFVEHGAPMVQLLREVTTHDIAPTYVQQLLTALETWGCSQAEAPTAAGVPASQPLIAPLSQRELEVLRLLDTELSGPEIACELVVAFEYSAHPHQRIYSKLNVTNRRAAVNRAVELNLI